MLALIVRCLHFVDNIAVFSWRLLTQLGYFVFSLLSRLTAAIGNILCGIAVFCEEFRRFVFLLKQAADEGIFVIRLHTNNVFEFTRHGCINVVDFIDNFTLTKEKLVGTSIDIVDLFLRSFYLIGDTAWWLLTLLPKSLYYLAVYAVDFSIFSIDLGIKCFFYFIQALVDNTMRAALTLTVILIIWQKWRNLLALLMLPIRLIVVQISRWRNRSIASFSRSIRCSTGRNSTPIDDAKLSDQQCCVVCKSRGKSVLLWPCRHLCLCDDCADVMKQQIIYSCPLCRTDVEFTISVYM